MTCKVCQGLIFELLDGALPASKEALVRAHVRSCLECGRFLEAERARLSGLPQALDRAALSAKLPPAAVERFFQHMEKAGKKKRLKQDKRASS